MNPALSITLGSAEWPMYSVDQIRQVVGVNEPEFEQYFLAGYEPLVRSLTAITGDSEIARDCVQDAFIKASAQWRKVSRYDNPLTWVRRVAINRSRDLHRTEQRRHRREQRASQAASIEAVEDGAALVDGSMQLVDLLKVLPDRQRSAAAMFYIEDLSIAEIAVVLGISAGAVKFHLNKARETLRSAITHDEQHRG